MKKKAKAPQSKSKRPGVATARPPIPAAREESTPQYPKNSPKPVWRKDSPLVSRPEAPDFEVLNPAPSTGAGALTPMIPQRLAAIISEAMLLFTRLTQGGIEDESISAEEILGDPYATVFESLAHELKVIQKLETSLKVRGDDIRAELLETVDTAGIERVAVRGIEMHPVEGSNSRLDPQLLLQNGVGADVIERSKSVKTYRYMKLVSLPGIELEKPGKPQSGAPE